MEPNRGKAFNRLPKALQVAMIYSGVLPQEDEDVCALAEKFKTNQ